VRGEGEPAEAGVGQGDHAPVAAAVNSDQLARALGEGPESGAAPEVGAEAIRGRGQQAVLGPERLDIIAGEVFVQLVQVAVGRRETCGCHREISPHER
jgi:hypothetical protein